MNKNLLHYILAKQGKTNEDVAKLLGISRQSYQQRLNGTINFRIEEVKAITQYLKLSDSDMMAIFFGNNVNE